MVLYHRLAKSSFSLAVCHVDIIKFKVRLIKLRGTWDLIIMFQLPQYCDHFGILRFRVFRKMKLAKVIIQFKRYMGELLMELLCANVRHVSSSYIIQVLFNTVERLK